MEKSTIKPINRRVEDTDLFVFGYNLDTGNFTYSRSFSQEEAGRLAETTNAAIDTQYKGVKGLRGGLTERNGSLTNMSTLKGIAANTILMNDSQGRRWLPTLEEGLALDGAGMLPKGVLVDFGIALYDGENPDREIAQAMMEFAKSRGFEPPVLASFSSLGLEEGGEEYGVTPQLINSKGLITGRDAVKVLERFYKGNSGVRRVGRNDYGVWSALWPDHLDLFSEHCRVGRFSAEGDEKKLKEEALSAFAPIQKSVDSLVEFAKTA
ncbi:MAG: hypothetical protein KJ559_01205 [Nanoarchaeota archaeon]|nr:hypothetical protein [Nanoarchaeota archaeon]